ncbi:hypothetical protein BD309DRAFT_997666 [Dichomitus squalens]|nr:hypothetical protein BD309DRAFT_997666 [Dichomitus squalens]
MTQISFMMSDHNSQIVLYVTQWWRGKDSEGKILPLHWALTFNTSGSDERPRGNVYNAAGNIDTLRYEAERGVPIRHDLWRGSLAVGRIPVESLDQFEKILSQNPVIRHDPEWNCQNWAWTALRELRHQGFAIEYNLTLHKLRMDMFELLEAWENGDI